MLSVPPWLLPAGTNSGLEVTSDVELLSLSSYTVFRHMRELGFSEVGSDTMKFSEREKYSDFSYLL